MRGLWLCIVLLCGTATAAAACGPGKLGVYRTVVMDTTGGPNHGSVNHGSSDLLGDKEVLLTFDDGPIPRRTNPILDALKDHCTKATFFMVGKMVQAYPDTARRVAREGHTIAGHTWNHANLGRTGTKGGIDQIERGFAAVEAVTGKPAARLFRFPYLRDTRALLKYLNGRDISSISIDIDSGDTRRDGRTTTAVFNRTMRTLRKRGRGILLFHDLKKATAQVMPRLLKQLAKEGFRVVHLQTKAQYPAKPALLARYRPKARPKPRVRLVAVPVRKPSRRVAQRSATTGTIGATLLGGLTGGVNRRTDVAEAAFGRGEAGDSSGPASVANSPETTETTSADDEAAAETGAATETETETVEAANVSTPTSSPARRVVALPVRALRGTQTRAPSRSEIALPRRVDRQAAAETEASETETAALSTEAASTAADVASSEAASESVSETDVTVVTGSPDRAADQTPAAKATTTSRVIDTKAETDGPTATDDASAADPDVVAANDNTGDATRAAVSTTQAGAVGVNAIISNASQERTSERAPDANESSSKADTADLTSAKALTAAASAAEAQTGNATDAPEEPAGAKPSSLDARADRTEPTAPKTELASQTATASAATAVNALIEDKTATKSDGDRLRIAALLSDVSTEAEPSSAPGKRGGDLAAARSGSDEITGNDAADATVDDSNDSAADASDADAATDASSNTLTVATVDSSDATTPEAEQSEPAATSPTQVRVEGPLPARIILPIRNGITDERRLRADKRFRTEAVVRASTARRADTASRAEESEPVPDNAAQLTGENGVSLGSAFDRTR